MNTPTISGGDNFITALNKISRKAGTAQAGARDTVTDTKVNDQRLQSPSKRSFRRMNDAANESDDDTTAALPDLRNEY